MTDESTGESQPADPRPTVGRVVHYQSYGTPRGEYSSQCRAAVITETGVLDGEPVVGLAVLNPTGLFFHPIAHENGPCPYSPDDHRGGTWHWPERTNP